MSVADALKNSKSKADAILKNLAQYRDQVGDDADGKLAAGKVWEISQSYLVAADLYAAARDSGEKTGEAQARLALALLKARQTKRALREAVQLVADHPKLTFATLAGAPTSALTVLGDALVANGQVEQGIAAYGNALELVPRDGHAAAKKATLHIKQGQLGEVRKLEAALANTEWFGAVSALARLAGNDGAMLPSVDSMRGSSMRFIATVAV